MEIHSLAWIPQSKNITGSVRVDNNINIENNKIITSTGAGEKIYLADGKVMVKGWPS